MPTRTELSDAALIVDGQDFRKLRDEPSGWAGCGRTHDDLQIRRREVFHRAVQPIPDQHAGARFDA